MSAPAPASAAPLTTTTQTFTFTSQGGGLSQADLWAQLMNWLQRHGFVYQRPVHVQPVPQRPPTQPQPPIAHPQPAPQPPQHSAPKGSSLTAQEQRMLDLVNQERQQRGLPALRVDAGLESVARAKAHDLVDNHYFSHQSPTYGSPFDMMRQFGVTYRTAGENLAGNQTVDAAHQALMNSSGHRANILSPNYTRVGIGIVAGSPYGEIFVQEFAG